MRSIPTTYEDAAAMGIQLPNSIRQVFDPNLKIARRNRVLAELKAKHSSKDSPNEDECMYTCVNNLALKAREHREKLQKEVASKQKSRRLR